MTRPAAPQVECEKPCARHDDESWRARTFQQRFPSAPRSPHQPVSARASQPNYAFIRSPCAFRAAADIPPLRVLLRAAVLAV